MIPELIIALTVVTCYVWFCVIQTWVGIAKQPMPPPPKPVDWPKDWYSNLDRLRNDLGPDHDLWQLRGWSWEISTDREQRLMRVGESGLRRLYDLDMIEVEEFEIWMGRLMETADV